MINVLLKVYCVSHMQPGFRDGMIQCFIKRDKSKLTYQLFLCLSPGMYLINIKKDKSKYLILTVYVKLKP